MVLLFDTVVTAALLLVVAYAQYRLPFHTRTRRSAWVARTVLVLVGLAFGGVWALAYDHRPGLEGVLALLMGFGIVHVPAAVILWIKRQRGVYR
jgi:hypothetical protein